MKLQLYNEIAEGTKSTIERCLLFAMKQKSQVRSPKIGIINNIYKHCLFRYKANAWLS